MGCLIWKSCWGSYCRHAITCEPPAICLRRATRCAAAPAAAALLPSAARVPRRAQIAADMPPPPVSTAVKRISIEQMFLPDSLCILSILSAVAPYGHAKVHLVLQPRPAAEWCLDVSHVCGEIGSTTIMPGSPSRASVYRRLLTPGPPDASGSYSTQCKVWVS
ncbi:hypothetical protein DFH27DRAFT_628871 [Peziza echinospora]|nr:hypothetical protein DFH27DRAFT_628871 [Peziza echinospora]